MFSKFRCDVLAKLANLDSATLKAVAQALDVVSTDYSITSAVTALSVVGREEFQQAAIAYLMTKRTEGCAQGTIKNTGLRINNFIMAINKPMDKVKTNDIRAYLYKYQDQRGISNRSLESVRSTICTFFKWLASEGYVTADPASNMKPIKYTVTPRKALSQLELERVRRACRDVRETAIIETLYSTGCRVSELCSIKVSDVDFDRREIMILGKGGKFRSVYLNAKAVVALQVYLKDRKNKKGERLIESMREGRTLQRSGIEDIFRRISSDTGIRVTPHIMRHTMATQALTGTGVEVVQRMLGHSNVSTTMIYAEVNQGTVKTAHERCII